MNTIVALSTPMGRSGIGVIRLSGADSLSVVRSLIDEVEFDPQPRLSYVRNLRDTTGEVIDEALITYFKAPHSFTGEDVVEIGCHGSPVLLRQVIDICLQLGTRMADAGEFSFHALANGRITLAEAEAIRDLIDSQTTAAARQAVRQLRGEFSHQLQPIKDDLLNIIVALESALEFVEDDLPDVQTEDIRRQLVSISGDVESMASTFRAGNLIREGIRVAIVGRPNVGKSSLFNALLGHDRAIVTDIAGTTRDQLHERFTINNIPVSLIDTAGLRETKDTVESIGVERSKRTIADADLVVVMLDVSETETDEDVAIMRSAEATDHIVVVNKIDKVGGDAKKAFLEDLKNQIAGSPAPVLEVSAKTGEGLDSLQRAIVEPFSPNEVNTNGFLVSDARHHDLLLRAGTEITQSLEALDSKASEEVILIGLHNALRYLGQITGETTTEDMLTRIFATFCIGK